MHAATIQAMPFASDDSRWAAVVSRNQGADGQFVYSVQSTGIYCRPTCPARRARRENVRFHPDCRSAEQAGFRPCKRCRPDQQSPVEHHAALVTRACRMIECAEEPPNLDTLAQAAGMSRFHFHRVFKSVTGLTPKTYALAWRTQRLRNTLPASASVTAAAYNAGYNSSAGFYAGSTQALGMTPSSYRAGGMGASIQYAVGQCTLGAVLVAATDQGLCAILLGDDPEALVRDIHERFPAAKLRSANRKFGKWVTNVIAMMEAPATGLNLPLDLRGTAFQQRVWRALREIPPGNTASYVQIARHIGAPGSARAVAGACAANPLAVAIPCHRAIRGDGALAGYRWGIERKRALLERESGKR